jgi:monoamine oxidase
MPPPQRRQRGSGRATPLLLPLLALLLLSLKTTTAQTPKPNSAVVIGAGLSGLAAADALCSKGYGVTILEGRSRTGGRAFTTRLPTTQVQVEVGAGWLHDAALARNSVYKLAVDNNLPTQVDDDEQQAWLVPGAPPLSAAAVFESRLAGWEATAAEFEDQIAEDSEDSWSATRPLKYYYDRWVASKGASLKGDDLAGVRTLLQSNIADLEYGAPLSKISAKWADEGEQGEGAERVLTQGYSSVVSLLEQRIASRPSCGPQTIQLDSRVVEIATVATGTSARPKGVYVKTAAGATVAAKFAITTLPLGVLKSSTASPRFVPALSSSKKSALSKLAMGLLNKVVLVYDDASFFQRDGAGGAPWPSEVSWFSPVTSASNPNPPADGDAFEFWSLNKFWPGSKAVVMLVGGDTASKWEAAFAGQPLADRDRQIAERADALFRQLFPSTTARLREYFVTRWASDPFSYGSYSYIPVGGSPTARTTLCAAQSKLLFWAGEHCSASYPSTANGALDSGVLAATAAMRAFPPPVSNGRR